QDWQQVPPILNFLHYGNCLLMLLHRSHNSTDYCGQAKLVPVSPPLSKNALIFNGSSGNGRARGKRPEHSKAKAVPDASYALRSELPGDGVVSNSGQICKICCSGQEVY